MLNLYFFEVQAGPGPFVGRQRCRSVVTNPVYEEKPTEFSHQANIIAAQATQSHLLRHIPPS
jgi:hypothetical protein